MRLKITDKKRFAMVIAVAVLLIAGAIWGIVRFKNHNNPKNQPQVFEVLVNIVDQKNSDPVEDARSSLKAGDVIAYFPEGHPWSETERISYLIVKIKLTPSEAMKMTQAKTQAVKEAQPPTTKTAEGGLASNAPKDMLSQTETVLARQYRLDLPGFDLQKFWENHEQPFGDKVFGAEIIDKK